MSGLTRVSRVLWHARSRARSQRPGTATEGRQLQRLTQCVHTDFESVWVHCGMSILRVLNFTVPGIRDGRGRSVLVGESVVGASVGY